VYSDKDRAGKVTTLHTTMSTNHQLTLTNRKE